MHTHLQHKKSCSPNQADARQAEIGDKYVSFDGRKNSGAKVKAFMWLVTFPLQF